MYWCIGVWCIGGLNKLDFIRCQSSPHKIADFVEAPGGQHGDFIAVLSRREVRKSCKLGYKDAQMFHSKRENTLPQSTDARALNGIQLWFIRDINEV